MKGRLIRVTDNISHIQLRREHINEAIGKNHNRIKCTFNNETWYSTIINTNESEAYIIIPNQIDELEKMNSIAEIEVSIEADHRVYKCSVPEELVIEMHENPIANNKFHRLSESLQRSIIYKIKSIIEPSERKRRARLALMSFV